VSLGSFVWRRDIQTHNFCILPSEEAFINQLDDNTILMFNQIVSYSFSISSLNPLDAFLSNLQVANNPSCHIGVKRTHLRIFCIASILDWQMLGYRCFSRDIERIMMGKFVS